MKSNEVFLSFLILVFLIFSLYWGLRCRKCKKIKKNRENYDLITKPDVSCKTQPVICPSGSYCPAMTGLPSICPMGSYCPSNGLSDPILCSTGYTCQTNGLTLQTICPSGSYCSTTTGPSILCPIGSYCPSSGLTGPILCSAGYTCQSNGLTLQTICPTGSYCPTTTGPPILCPIGSYCPLTGMVKPVKNIIKDIKLFDTKVYNGGGRYTKINFTSVIIRYTYNDTFILREIYENGKHYDRNIIIPYRSYSRNELASRLSQLLTNWRSDHYYVVSNNSTLFTFTVTPAVIPSLSFGSLVGVSLVFNDKSAFDELGFSKNKTYEFNLNNNNKYVLSSANINTQIFGVPDINNSTYTSTRNVLLKSINLSFQITNIVSLWSLPDNEVKFNLYLFNNQNTSALFTIDQIIDVSLWSVQGINHTPRTQNTYSFNFTPNEPINIDNNSYFFLNYNSGTHVGDYMDLKNLIVSCEILTSYV